MKHINIIIFHLLMEMTVCLFTKYNHILSVDPAYKLVDFVLYIIIKILVINFSNPAKEVCEQLLSCIGVLRGAKGALPSPPLKLVKV